MYTAKHTFFCQSITAKCLSEDESNHAIRVLRLKEGNEITVIDGNGTTATATISLANKKRLEFEILQTHTETRKEQYIHIVIAPTKNMDRFSFFLEKTIEIGIDRITPILCKNSERKNLNIEKLRKAAVSAVKQSGQLFLPQVDDLMTIEHFMESDINDSQRFIAHCEEDQEKCALKNEINTKKNVVILIGPEGDFTNEEINLAKQNSFQPVSLGESRLRTETAGIVACHTVNII